MCIHYIYRNCGNIFYDFILLDFKFEHINYSEYNYMNTYKGNVVTMFD